MKSILKKYFLPSMYVDTYLDVTSSLLKSHNKKAVMVDLDNTLVSFDEPNVNEEVIHWVKHLKNNGINILILSNGKKARVEKFCKNTEIPYLEAAKKPLMKNFHKGVQRLDVKKSDVVMVGDQLMTDILGANRTRIDSILVLPVKDKDAWATVLNRKIERMILKWINDKDLLKWRNG